MINRIFRYSWLEVLLDKQFLTGFVLLIWYRWTRPHRRSERLTCYSLPSQVRRYTIPGDKHFLNWTVEELSGRRNIYRRSRWRALRWLKTRFCWICYKCIRTRTKSNQYQICWLCCHLNSFFIWCPSWSSLTLRTRN